MKLFRERRADRSETAQFVTFFVDDLFLGIEAVRVQEVLRLQQMTPIPLAPPAVRGLINLRGQIVTAIDTRVAFGLSPLRESEPFNLILGGEDAGISLLVDAIGDVLDVPNSSFSPMPGNAPHAHRDKLSGVYTLPDRLMLLLNVARTLDTACREVPSH
jgi:purine-binding chemotaxis protein CheW